MQDIKSIEKNLRQLGKLKNKEDSRVDKKPTINFDDYSHIAVTGNRVMVKLIPIDYSVTKGGISLGTKVKTTFLQGVVVSVGKGVPVVLHDTIDKITPPFELGDVVYFSDMAGVDFKLRQDDFDYEDVKVIDVDSIYFVDGRGKEMYKLVNEEDN